MPPEPQTDSLRDQGDGVDETALAEVMQEVPKGAAALAGVAVAILTILWVVIYLFVFVPRGTVG